MRRVIRLAHRVWVRMLTTALAALLLGQGLALFPIPAGSKVAPAGWHGRVTVDPDVVAAWPAGINVGVGCRASTIVGVDLDRKDHVDGVVTFQALCAAARRPWPVTFTVATPHGVHLYFRAPAGVVVPSSINRWPGVDIRSPGRRLGGYLIAPGSVVAGCVYTVTRDTPVVPLPPWLEGAMPPGVVRDPGRSSTSRTPPPMPGPPDPSPGSAAAGSAGSVPTWS